MGLTRDFLAGPIMRITLQLIQVRGCHISRRARVLRRSVESTLLGFFTPRPPDAVTRVYQVPLCEPGLVAGSMAGRQLHRRTWQGSCRRRLRDDGSRGSADPWILRRDSNRRRCTRISIRWRRRRCSPAGSSLGGSKCVNTKTVRCPFSLATASRVSL